MYFSALLRYNVHTVKFHHSQLHYRMSAVKCMARRAPHPTEFFQTPLQPIPAPRPLATTDLPFITTVLP